LAGKHNGKLIAHAPHIENGLISETNPESKEQNQRGCSPHNSENGEKTSKPLLVQVSEKIRKKTQD
jgi:hypothetical protein